MSPSDIQRQSEFHAALRSRIERYFTEQGVSPYADTRAWVKMIGLFSAFVAIYVLIMTNWFHGLLLLGLAIVWGCCGALVAFNIPHDALHGAISPNARVNQALSYVFNLVGMNAYTWKLKHNMAHHAFTNVPGWDLDIEAGPLLRFSPNDRLYWFHRYQHWYAPVLYVVVAGFIMLVMDFRILMDRQVAERLGVEHPVQEYFVLAGSKAIYLTYSLILPLWWLAVPWWQVLLGYAVVHAVIGVLSGLVLLPSHCMNETVFPDRDTQKQSWLRYQLLTTLDFERESPWANFLFGGFNTNAIHHIFPHIHHVHYGPLSAILAQAADEFDMPYHEDSLVGAIRSHLVFLSRMGREVNPYPVANPGSQVC